MRRAELIRDWLPALTWSVVLIAVSGRAGSSGITERVLQLVVPAASPVFDPLHDLVRKTIHVLAYGTLGALDFRAVRGRRAGWRLRWSVIAVSLAVLVAIIDEWHQSFVPERTGSPLDVLIDCAGATLAQMILKRRATATDSPETS